MFELDGSHLIFLLLGFAQLEEKQTFLSGHKDPPENASLVYRRAGGAIFDFLTDSV